MKKLINVPLLIFFTSIIGHSQIPLIIEGQTYTNSDDSWSGVNIPRSVSTLLTFRNNSITSVNTVAICSSPEMMAIGLPPTI